MPVKADNDITIGGNSYIDDYITNDEYKRINYSGLLMEYLRQGGTVDITNINTSSNDLASDVLNSFGDFAVDVLRETGNFIDWIGNGDVFQEEIVVNRDPVAWKPALRQDVFQLIGQLPFMYLNKDDGDTPVPTPDTNYLTYLDAINGSGFWFKNFPNKDGFNISPALIQYPPSTVSWYCTLNNFGTNGIMGQNYYCGCYNIFDINIAHDNNLYFIDFNLTNPIKNFILAGDTSNPYNYGVISLYNGGEFDSMGSDTLNYTIHIQYSNESLSNVLTYIYNTFKNVNIYVDGILWSYAGDSSSTNYSIQLGTGTVVPTTNGRVEWKYDDEIYIDIDLIWQLLDRFINDPNRNTTIIDFGVLKDCIVDANGQTAIAVKVIQDDPLSIDDQLVLDYGTLIPVFPVAVDYPIDVRDTARIAVIGVQVLPSDIIEIVILGIFGMLFVCFVHRGLE